MSLLFKKKIDEFELESFDNFYCGFHTLSSIYYHGINTLKCTPSNTKQKEAWNEQNVNSRIRTCADRAHMISSHA